MSEQEARTPPDLDLNTMALLATGMFLYVGLWLLGVFLGTRAELISRLESQTDALRRENALQEREEALRVEQARHAERARIAQEMHDTLAHRISLLAIHSNLLTCGNDLSNDEVAEHAAMIRSNADLAVAELAQVLGVLRAGSTPTSTVPRLPTLSLLPLLIDDSRQAGTPVTLVGGMPGVASVPDLTSRTAFRVLQEALTNARKHATGLPVTIRLCVDEGESVTVEASNPVPQTGSTSAREQAAGSGPAVRGTGNGLVGMAERVGLAGGTLEYGEQAGTFVIRASLPWCPAGRSRARDCSGSTAVSRVREHANH